MPRNLGDRRGFNPTAIGDPKGLLGDLWFWQIWEKFRKLLVRVNPQAQRAPGYTKRRYHPVRRPEHPLKLRGYAAPTTLGQGHGSGWFQGGFPAASTLLRGGFHALRPVTMGNPSVTSRSSAL